MTMDENNRPNTRRRLNMWATPTTRSNLLAPALFFCSILLVNVGEVAEAMTKSAPGPTEAVQVAFSATLLLDSLDRTDMPTVCGETDPGGQFERVTIPVDWRQPQGPAYQMRIYHTRKDFRNKKKALVFLGGGPGEPIEQYRQISDWFDDGLGEEWDSIFLDTRGSGCSQHKRDGGLIDVEFLTMAQTADDVRALVSILRRRGVDKIVLAGGSSGAHIALGYATRYSETIDLLYLDAVGGSSDFVNLSAKLAYDKISKRLLPTDLETVSKAYGIDKNVIYKYLFEAGARDVELKANIWYLLKTMSPQGKKEILRRLHRSVLSPSFSGHEQIPDLLSAARLYYVMACREILPAKFDRYPYDFYSEFDAICPRLLAKYRLQRQPYNYLPYLKQVSVPTVIANGIEDYCVPFAAGSTVYEHLDKRRSILLGFRGTGHVALVGHHKFIFGAIKDYLDNGSRQRIKQRASEYEPAVFY